MRFKFLLATIASHMVAPLPVHAIDALLATILWLVARTAFGWFRTTPRPFAKLRRIAKVSVLRAARVYRTSVMRLWPAGPQLLA